MNVRKVSYSWYNFVPFDYRSMRMILLYPTHTVSIAIVTCWVMFISISGLHTCVSSVWWLPVVASASGKAALEDCMFGVASRVQSHDFLVLKPKVCSLLFIPGNSLVNDIVLWVQPFWRMKNLRSLIGRRKLLCNVSFLEALLLDKIISWSDVLSWYPKYNINTSSCWIESKSFVVWVLS
jgi:hypothetical protein